MDSSSDKSSPSSGGSLALRALRAQRAYPNEADWERCRARIAQLYSNHPLPHVVDIMARDHGFHAT